jgi:hypothetical protein
MPTSFPFDEPLSRIERLRLDHHLKAMTVATLEVSEELMAAYLRMTIERLRLLKNDPTFANLVASYRQRWQQLT